jgi:hypothetical protein
MRFAVFAAVIFLSACASEQQSSAPPPGVDFSGQWKLNSADSDDPTHLAQAASAQAGAARGGGSGGQGGQGGGGGRGGGRGGGNAPGLGNPGAIGPATPPMSALAQALRWPGKALEIKQAGGILTFTSDGKARVCQPGSHEKKSHHHDSKDSDALPSEREAPPPRCSWSDKTLIVQGNDSEEERPSFEEHYSVTADGQRLVEMVSFKGARYNGFTASRVWDRIALSVN